MGRVQRAAVLGHPIAHSLSPVLHRTAYAELGLDWEYSALDVTSADLPGLLDSLGPEWVGLSLTMPLKETAIGLLTDVDQQARTVRAVNTVLLNGSVRSGFNTDITGLTAILTDALVGPSRSAGVIGTVASGAAASGAVVIGAGATARSAVAALASVGVQRVLVLARSSAAVAELCELADPLGVDIEPGEWPPTADALASDIVVSTVPALVAANFPRPERPGLLVDVLYHPWPTPLASSWTAGGGGVVGGLELLVRQAVEQVELMTGRRPSVDRLRAAGSAALDARSAGAASVSPGTANIAQAEQ